MNQAAPSGTDYWITYDEAARRAGMARETIRSWCKRKWIRRRAAGRLIIDSLSLERYLETGKPQG